MLRLFSKQPVTRLSRTKLSCLNTKSFSTPARQVPVSSKKSNSLSAVKPWSELSTPQKVVAASKTTMNLGVIAAGVTLTTAIVYYITSELFSSQSPTSIFNDVVDRIRVHEELVQILGEPIKGHGEPSRNKRRRNRRIASQEVEDQNGDAHLFMRFYVEGPINQGTVALEMIKDDKNKWQYKQLYVDVPGQGLPSKRIYLERQ
ncbi:TIM21-domain-containing protein [Gilbertella persicaria]|uniref:Mitochondrial import inner membrane translocase subunit Tim21 n=1 Tax=Rhizopus stolonifer TaxID=4846 RepID=A0A367J3D9_RHIST|nr:TIM21-domain-containing protein [Gilbertella persicaria]KAI8085878.1 TIM21-domain-containing protein [Gilbertella persicaria]RCH84448.1 hypothetical protein CU098_005377 [Rhizopus stolonifer]